MWEIINSLFMTIVSAKKKIENEIIFLKNDLESGCLSTEEKQLIQNRIEQLRLLYVTRIDELSGSKRVAIYQLHDKYKFAFWEIKRAHKYIKEKIDYSDKSNTVNILDSKKIKKNFIPIGVFAVLIVIFAFIAFISALWVDINSSFTSLEIIIELLHPSSSFLMMIISFGIVSYFLDENISIDKANKILKALETQKIRDDAQ